MPNATITSTASTFGTITGTFADSGATVTGTISGIITGTLDGSVGVPGIGVPAGGTTGQYLTKVSNTDFATQWSSLDLSNYLSLDGGVMNPNSTVQFSDDFTHSQSEIGGYGLAIVNSLDSNALTNVLSDRIFVRSSTSQTTLIPSGIQFNDSSIQTTAFTGWNNVALTGNPTAPTAALADNDTSIATTAFVQQELASGTAVAKNLEVDVRNQSGSTIPAGSIVYISGATGNKPLITLAQANNDANSAQTFGFVKEAIANNGTGHVIVRGELTNIDTSALTEGAQLYLSPTTAGTWTTTKPYAPDHLVYVGIVVRAHPTQGIILVAVQNGYELEELHNVAISSVANGDLLVYESATTLWKNKSVSTLGLATQSWVTSQAYLTSAALASLTDVTMTSPSNGQVLTYDSASSKWVNGTASGGAVWGSITGTLSSQSDLNTALGLKAPLASPSFTGTVITPASTTSGAGLRITAGVAPTAPTNGDIWQDGTNLNVRIAGTTQALPALGTTNSFSGSNTFTGSLSATGTPCSIGGGSIAMNVSLAAGLTPSGSTKTVNIGNNSQAGSTTNITIGSSAGTSTTTLQGTTNGVTAAADTNTTALATTAFVVGQAGSATPLVNGTAAVGTSLRYARQDHVHGTDTSRAPLASPSLTGTPLAPTAAADTNTTQIATTAFVVGQASASTPLSDGTAAIGTSLKYARADHVHPTDTSLAPLASPSLTGTPTAPTAAVDTNTTQIATTAYVVGQGYAKLASPTLTGTPLAPTAAAGTNTTQIATTAFVNTAAPANVQTFTTAGTATWTKPAGKTMVWVRMYGAGGGGGSGARYATTSIRGGGGGGGAGGYLEFFIPASALASTVTVTVGAGGVGGTAVTTDTTSGNTGSVAGTTSFSIYRAAVGSAGGGGGNVSGGTGGVPGVSSANGLSITGVANGGTGGSTAAPTAPTASSTAYHPSTSGGGGAGQNASVTTSFAGAAGANKNANTSGLVSSIAGGSGGTVAGVAPTTGASGVTNWYGGTGGGGGAYITGVAGMAGANGGQPGGGGGGGSASDNGFNSGAGGNGADGMVIVVSY